MFNKLIITCVLLLSASVSYAIDKESHPTVTQYAIDDYNQCVIAIHAHYKNEGILLSTISKDSKSVISTYSKIEDEAPLWDRLTNWHFYDKFYKKSGSKHLELKKVGWFGFMNPSMHELYDRRVATLQALQNGDLESNRGDEPEDDIITVDTVTGRILHFIEDMGVPEHVSPIYHSKPDGWFQALFVPDEPSHFDELFTQENIISLGDVKTSPERCLELYTHNKEQPTNLTKILTDMAELTLDRMDDVITVPKNHVWFNKAWNDIFWPIRTGRIEDAEHAHYKYGEHGFLQAHSNTFSLKEKDNVNKADDIDLVKQAASLEFFKNQYMSIKEKVILALMVIDSKN